MTPKFSQTLLFRVTVLDRNQKMNNHEVRKKNLIFFKIIESPAQTSLHQNSEKKNKTAEETWKKFLKLMQWSLSI